MISRFAFLVAVAPIFVSPSLAQETPKAQETPPAPAAPEGMVLVPAGAFQMGTNNPDGLVGGDNTPRHEVVLPAFFIDKTEVTNAQYKKYCDATGYPTPPQWVDGKIPEGEADFPVTRVNWWEARAYARWAGKRLPSEAEWEKAARGTDGRSYPWGEGGWDGDHVAVGPRPMKVGSKPAGASPYGALDMAANVFEWVDDWYGPYPKSALAQSPHYGQLYKVMRGGAHDVGGHLARTYFRSIMKPQSRNVWVGFRCAQSP